MDLLVRTAGEASALLRGLDHRSYWTAIDEAPATTCLARINMSVRGTDSWRLEPVDAVLARGSPRTQDVESIARYGGFVYLIGSQYGRPGGPLEPRRSFLARFREQPSEAGPVHISVVRAHLLLHRIVNDRLAASGVALAALSDAARRGYIDRTIELGRRRGKAWSDRIRPTDLPINVEGAAFDVDGSLLLGLRFPVTADGRPIIVRVAGVPECFETGSDDAVRATAVYVLEEAGSTHGRAGIRDLEIADGRLHALVGGLDAEHCGPGERPGSRAFEHLSTPWPPGAEATELPASLVRRFRRGQRAEGLATDGNGGFVYVAERLPEVDRPVKGRVAVLVLPRRRRATT